MLDDLSGPSCLLLSEPASSDWEAYLPWGKERFYPKRSIVYSAGEHVDHLYYIKSGLVKQFTMTPEGSEKAITIIKSGNIFGEGSFFHGYPCLCNYSVIRDSSIYMFSREVLSLLSRRNPHILYNLLSSMSLKMRMLATQINVLALNNASARVERIIHLLAEEYPQNRIEIKLRHQDIADLSGVHRVTVSRTLSQLRRHGVLEYRGSQFAIRDKG